MIINKFIRWGRYSGKRYAFADWDPATNRVV